MNRNQLQKVLETAIEHQKAGRHDEAEALYAQVRRDKPKLYDGWYLSGTLAFQRGGHLEQAVEYLSRARQLDRQAAECSLFLGMALADLGRYEDAIKPLQSALKKYPAKAEAWENLAKSLEGLSRKAEAIDAWEHALALQPTRGEWRERLEALRSRG
jgi:superkiller protein 3